MFVGVITNDLNRVLVGTYCTVSTQTVEFSFIHTGTAQCYFFFLWKRSESNIVNNTNCKMIFRHG